VYFDGYLMIKMFCGMYVCIPVVFVFFLLSFFLLSANLKLEY